MPRRFPFILLILLASLSGPASMSRLPMSLSGGAGGEVPAILLPSPATQRLLAEDALASKTDRPFRVGVSHDLDRPLAGSARVETLPAGGCMWRMAVRSPGALWLSLIFSEFELPEGVGLFVFAPAGGGLLGPYSSADNREFRRLATPVVAGDTAVIEVDFAPGIPAVLPLRLESAVAGYRPLFEAAKGSGTCEVDINCPEGAGWQRDKRAVAMIYFPPGYLCTGTLLNNVREDCRNYFLTAHHCISKESEAEGAVFYWNYEWTGCGSGELLGDVQSGAVLKATSARSDFTLMELAAPPDPGLRLYYAGWSASAEPARGAVGIHHPAGDAKKISIENDPLISTSSFWRVPDWDTGVTEGGSSGSGLWNPDHQVVGQLQGGASACGNPENQMWDEYGKLSVSWSAGSSASSRLRDWLDPDGTGTLVMPGKPGTACGLSAHTRPVAHP